MSAIFMNRHRFSTINPDDIARISGTNSFLNSISFQPLVEDEEEEDEDELEEEQEPQKSDQDEEKRIGTDDNLIKRRRSTKTRPVDPRVAAIRKLKRRWNKLSHRYGFKHIIPIILLLVYSIIGAVMFSAVELPYAQEKRVNILAKLDQNRKWTADSLIRQFGLANNSRNYDAVLTILEQSDANNSLPAPEVITWNVWGALFYVGQIYTTIGYGNIYPETPWGYALTILYAFIGVPLVLAILSDIGQLLALYSSKGWRYLLSHMPNIRKKPKTAAESVIPESGVPVTLCLLLTFGWLIMCSALFCLWEKNWTFFKAFYFFFISLSTIGLGDIVPEQPEIMIGNFYLVIIGLCLVSMTLGVVQEHITLFLYRMMMELQKECETMLANGEDVNTNDLVERVWENQPWFVRKFMPSFVSEVQQQSLEDYAGAAITDTAVSMGLIPPPPNYVPKVMQIQPSVVEPMKLLPSPAVVVSAPLAMIAEAKMKPVAVAMAAPKVHGASPLSEPLSLARQVSVPMQNPQNVRDIYPEGNVVIKRSMSQRNIPPEKPIANRAFTSLTDLQQPSPEQHEERLQRALKTRVATTQTIDQPIIKSTCDTDAQTDLLGNDIAIKSQTLSTMSLASWYEEDESVPFNLPQLQELTVEELRNVPGIAQMLKSRRSLIPEKNLRDSSAQTDDHPDAMSITSSSDEEYVSAAETRSLLLPPSLKFVSKFVQTAPMNPRTSLTSLPSTACMESQTSASNYATVEVQTSQTQNVDTEVQCQPLVTDDEEAQTYAMATQTHNLSQPDLLPRYWSQDSSIDRAVQTVFTRENVEKEIQTVPLKTRNLETQTDINVQQCAESQTEHSSFSRRSSSEGNGSGKVRIRSECSTDDDTGDTEEYVTAKLPGWSYNAWISNRDRLSSLHSVPEEEDESGEEDIEEEEGEEGEDEGEMDDMGMAEDEENTDLQELHGFTEEENSEGINLPALTAKNDHEDDMTMDEGDDDRLVRKPSRSSRQSLKLSWKDKILEEPREEVITASIATQTEELITRRQSFPRDQFTSKMKDPKVVFQAESTEPDRSHSHGLIHWIRSGKKRFSKGFQDRHGEQHSSLTVRDAAVQTDCLILDNTREIMIQTDESYLMKARKFEKLREHRTKSLAVAVAPHLKERLAQVAARAKVSAAAGSSSEQPRKKYSPPKRK